MLLKHEKVWIAGASGQVGSAFAKMLDTTAIDVLLTDIDDVDITDMDAVRDYAEMTRPDVIINCAGVSGLDFCQKNKDLAYSVNAIGARNLSVAARIVHAEIIHISTDDIFDGTSDEPYDEFCQPSPISVYGKSKLAGEDFVRTIAPKHLIIRSSWVYGNGQNFVTDLLAHAKEGKPFSVPKGQIGCPTSAIEVAKVIGRLLEKDAYGTYNAVCQGSCSRMEFARKILELCKLDIPLIESDENTVGRPSYSVLDNLMLRLNHIELPQNWEDALKFYLRSEGYVFTDSEVAK